MIADLIDTEIGCWKSELIQNHFQELEQDKTLNIPLLTSDEEDRLIWHHNSKGVYTVKSGYYLKMEIEMKQEIVPLPSPSNSSSIFSQVLEAMWATPIQHRAKHFMWRLLHDSLPIRSNLKKHGLGDGIFLVCGEADETLNHLFHHCVVSKAVAEAATLIARWLSFPAPNLLALLLEVNDKKGVRGISCFTNFLWQIWKARCFIVF